MADQVQYYGTGRRKSSVARVFLRPGSGKFQVNGRELEQYFLTQAQRVEVKQPLVTSETTATFDISANVSGGGINGQAGALKMGIARALLIFTLLSAAVNLAQPGAIVSLLPDYLVLAFFCVTLYYKERLVFFDLLIKRGAFFALALVGLTLFFVAGPSVYDRLPQDWSRAWIIALLLTPFFLIGPWIYRRLAEGIDRVWLRRPYSAAEAERQFTRDVQVSLTEQDLQSRARESLRRHAARQVAPLRLEGGPGRIGREDDDPAAGEVGAEEEVGQGGSGR